MSGLHYVDDQLYLENVSLKKIAEEFGTPTYVYSRKTLETNWRKFDDAFNKVPHLICYAVKANSNLAILQLFARLNSGFDIVSGGELERVIAAGGNPNKIVFSGVGKTKAEIAYAIDKKIYCFDVESAAELNRLQEIANEKGQKIKIALRVNPNIDPQTHAHISTGLKENKFGIDINEVIPLCKKLNTLPNLQLIGIACHIGSQITQMEPFLLAIESLLQLYAELQTLGITLQHLNIGGGLGIRYQNENPPSIQAYAQALQAKLANHTIELMLEPGRALIGEAGLLLTRVEYLKEVEHKNFVICDAGMNDLMRPALYDAWQPILPVELHQVAKKHYDIAGPVCESADFLGKNRELAVLPGDLLVIDKSGAYGFSMSSNYNSRPRAAEILIDDNQIHLIRRRETMADLLALENTLDKIK